MPDIPLDQLRSSLAPSYEIERELGRGGMATVYLAHDRRHGRRVAIKVLLPELWSTIGAERFLREVHVVARLQHPHILPLFDSGRAGELLYFVMPFVDGESLRARLERERAVPLGEMMRILRQLADALDYAHANGVVHRDLKPENVLLAGRQALLADFGVARAPAQEPVGGGTLTAVGTTLGTPAYMSPEQAAAEREIDGRSDVYSLGCVCYEMLAGEPPFQGPSAMALIVQHIVSPAPALVGAREAMPPGVCDAVARALAKDAGDRYATAGELAAALEAAIVEAREPSPADRRIHAVEREHEARQRVLVLEFTNLTGAPDADWLSTGITETVSADLNKVGGIKVIGRAESARAAMGGAGTRAATQPVELARAAGARWVVWGAFQKAGARVRITTHVAGTEAGDPAREEKIDGVMDDIFTLQDRIVTTLADALRIELTSGDVERIRRPETTHLTAYEHYSRGFRARIMMGKESAKTAERHFRAAIELDPAYALAYAGLGALHMPMYIASGDRQVLDHAVELLERATALDPTLAEPHTWLAYMLARQHRFNDAESAALRAVELEPGSFDAWYMLGTSRAIRGHALHEPASLARAVPPLLRSAHLRPEGFSGNTNMGAIYVLRGAYGHAQGPVDAALRRELLDPDVRVLGPLILRAVLHMGRSELDEAERLLARAVSRYTGADHVYAEAMASCAHWALGCVAERREDMARAFVEFERAADIAEAHPHRISIGAHWAKARFGMTRALHRAGRPAEAERVFAEADALFATRGRFVWSWFLGGGDCDVLYERASALATLGRRDPALAGLRRAADACWADVTWLRHDPAFAVLRDTEEVQGICADATSRVELPPPTGTGGLG